MEVGPRDGLQNESALIPLDVKLRFVRSLADAGLKEIEATSFVSPKWVPQLGDAAELWPKLPEGPLYSALVPNLKGLERALDLDVQRIAVFTAASESFTKANVPMTIAETLDQFRLVIARFRHPCRPNWARGYVSTAFECPYEGRINPKKVLEVCEALIGLGVDEISIGDTIGVASPAEVRVLGREILAAFGNQIIPKITWHFHDTWGTGLANLSAALDLGFRSFDSSAGGLGGCPYAPGAGGNLATEDVIYLLERTGISTGVDLDSLSRATEEVLACVGRSPAAKSQIASLGRSSVG